LRTILADFAHLFFPHLCAGCGSDLVGDGRQLCLRCHSRLEETHFANLPGNPVEKSLWGRLPIIAGYSQYYFAKHTVIQQVIHELKYKGNKAIGQYMGRLMGESLATAERFRTFELLAPLPLFPDKEKKRGYNQAMLLCEGIAEVMHLPVAKDA